MLLFVSYARKDQSTVHPLVEGLRTLGHDVWLDEELTGGQTWWNAILEQIRACDALVLGLSPAALDSPACERERHYALALGKPILPVLVESVLPELLPPDLAPVQLVDLTTNAQESAYRLARAVSMLPPSPPLPNPPPTPPVAPISYLTDLSHRVHASTLALDEQLALVGRLKTALERAEERDAAIRLLTSMQQREDLYYATAKELEGLYVALGLSPSGADKAVQPQLEVEVLGKAWAFRSLVVTCRKSHRILLDERSGSGLLVNGQEIKYDEVSGSGVTPGHRYHFHLIDGADTLSGELYVKAIGFTPIFVLRHFQLKIEDEVVYEDRDP